MKTIRNSVFIGASLLGGCTSVETYFDALHVACVKDACLWRKKRATLPKTWIALIALTKPTFRGCYFKRSLSP
ncbi:hypothetical protein HpBT352_11240 [Helicobacter pylori]